MPWVSNSLSLAGNLGYFREGGDIFGCGWYEQPELIMSVCECTHKNLTYEEFPNLFYYLQFSFHLLCNYPPFSLAPALLVRPPWLLLCFCPMKFLVILLLHVPHCYIAISSLSAISSLVDAHLPTVRDSEGESPSLEVIRSGFARHSSVGQSDTCWRARCTAVSRCFLTGGQFGSRQVFPSGCWMTRQCYVSRIQVLILS